MQQGRFDTDDNDRIFRGCRDSTPKHAGVVVGKDGTRDYIVDENGQWEIHNKQSVFCRRELEEFEEFDTVGPAYIVRYHPPSHTPANGDKVSEHWLVWYVRCGRPIKPTGKPEKYGELSEVMERLWTDETDEKRDGRIIDDVQTNANRCAQYIYELQAKLVAIDGDLKSNLGRKNELEAALVQKSRENRDYKSVPPGLVELSTMYDYENALKMEHDKVQKQLAAAKHRFRLLTFRARNTDRESVLQQRSTEQRRSVVQRRKVPQHSPPPPQWIQTQQHSPSSMSAPAQLQK